MVRTSTNRLTNPIVKIIQTKETLQTCKLMRDKDPIDQLGNLLVIERLYVVAFEELSKSVCADIIVILKTH